MTGCGGPLPVPQQLKGNWEGEYDSTTQERYEKIGNAEAAKLRKTFVFDEDSVTINGSKSQPIEVLDSTFDRALVRFLDDNTVWQIRYVDDEAAFMMRSDGNLGYILMRD